MPQPSRRGCAACWSARPPDVTTAASPAFAPDLTLGDAESRLRLLLRQTGAGDAAFEARILLEEATGLGRTALLQRGERELGQTPARTLNGWLARRLRGEPLWRVLGTREFWGLPFAVSPAVLDPRPDTETVVEAALSAMAARRAENLHVLDLGTGSGAILGALLHEWPQARGWGLDLSLAACRVAAANLAVLGLGARAQIVNGRWADPVLATRFFDVVVSNPPYIETDVIPTLDRAVRDFDPILALDGGQDGLAAYRAIAAALPGLLRPHGVVVLEVGRGQAGTVSDLLALSGFGRRSVRRDLAGIERVVLAAD